MSWELYSVFLEIILDAACEQTDRDCEVIQLHMTAIINVAEYRC